MEPEEKYTEEWYAWYLRKHHLNQEHLRVAIVNGLNTNFLKKYIRLLEKKQKNNPKKSKADRRQN